MEIHSSDSTQRRFARIAGMMYLANYATAVAGVAGMSAIKGEGAFAARAASVIASDTLYRAALTSMAVSWVILSLQAYALYITVRPVNKAIAQIALVLEASQAVVGAVSVMFGFSILRIYLGVEPSGAFSVEQMQLLNRVVNAAYDSGFSICMLFFAPASLLFFLLFFRARYLPPILAGMGVAGSALLIVSTTASLIDPAGTRWLMYATWVPMGIAEVGTGFWLALKGIRTPPAQSV